MFDDFLALSRILTGVQNLDAELGRQYLDRLTSTPFEPGLHQILERFRELKDGDTRVDQVKREILANDMFRSTVCQINLLWYKSAMRDNLTIPLVMRYGSQEGYFQRTGVAVPRQLPLAIGSYSAPIWTPPSVRPFRCSRRTHQWSSPPARESSASRSSHQRPCHWPFIAPGQWFAIRPILQRPHRKVFFAGEHIVDEQVSWKGRS